MISYFKVRGKSMEPLCQEGDFVILDRLSYFFVRPRVGDIVVLHHPSENRLLLKYVRKEDIGQTPFHYWVEGVNKKQSSDSRVFGWIPREMILGKARIIPAPRRKVNPDTGFFSL